MFQFYEHIIIIIISIKKILLCIYIDTGNGQFVFVHLIMPMLFFEIKFCYQVEHKSAKCDLHM